MTYLLHGFYDCLYAVSVHSLQSLYSLYPVCIQSLYSLSTHSRHIKQYTDTINSSHQSLHTTNANKSSMAEIPALSFFSADATILFSIAAVRVGLAGGCWTDRASFPSFLVFSSFLPSFLLQPHLSISLPSLFHLFHLSPSLSSSPSLLHLFSFLFFSSSFVGSSPSYKQPFFVISQVCPSHICSSLPCFCFPVLLSLPPHSFLFLSFLLGCFTCSSRFFSSSCFKKLHLSPSFFPPVFVFVLL